MSEYIIRPPEKVGSSLDLQPIIVGEIVRCRDCSWFCEGSEVYATNDWCKNFGCETDGDGYCAWSKRRADA